jgi:phosphodiesterase/alkaline phosphatase D-like protein
MMHDPMHPGLSPLHCAALPDAGQEPFWEFVSGPIHAGSFPQNRLDNTFGPQIAYVKGGKARENTSISGREAAQYIRFDSWFRLSCHRAQASGADPRRACPATGDIPALA